MKNSIILCGLAALIAATSFGLMSSVDASASEASTEPRSSAPAKTGGIEGEFISHKRLKTRGPTSERDVVL
ncbi:MAG: hypothetical protein AAGG01_24090, partial [Planctomycetota bacterium]